MRLTHAFQLRQSICLFVQVFRNKIDRKATNDVTTLIVSSLIEIERGLEFGVRANQREKQKGKTVVFVIAAYLVLF